MANNKTAANDIENIKTVSDALTDNNTAASIVSYKGKGKGSNPNSLKNLSKITSSEVARERGRKGGLKSGETKRARKTMAETILELIQKEVDPADYGGDAAILGDKATLQEVILAAMVREATNGDTKAMQLLRDTIGEQPVNRQEVRQEIITQDDLQTINNLKDYLTG